MAKRTPTKRTKVVDPTFFIPTGVEDWEYNADAEGDSDDTLDGYVDEPDEPGILQPPGTLKVVSMNIRKKRNGDEVVDLVVEVEDIPGAEEYNLRVTKA